MVQVQSRFLSAIKSVWDNGRCFINEENEVKATFSKYNVERNLTTTRRNSTPQQIMWWQGQAKRVATPRPWQVQVLDMNNDDSHQNVQYNGLCCAFVLRVLWKWVQSVKCAECLEWRLPTIREKTGRHNCVNIDSNMESMQVVLDTTECDRAAMMWC